MDNILEAREQRSKHIKQLMKQYPSKSTVILKTNVVGTNKNPIHMRFICAFFNDLMLRTFRQKIILMGKQKSADGNYCYFVIDEVGTLVKERTIELEEHNELGRLVDLDVYHVKPISRQDLQCEMRRCLLCQNYAHMCARNRTHSEQEIHAKVFDITTSFLIDYLTNTTIKAIYSELELYPKFGLVSHRDSGCHVDMDYETFIASTHSIRQSIEDYIREGCRESINPSTLQKIGLEAEAHMMKATGNINTQKGLIFLLGIFLPAVTKTILHNQSESDLQQEIITISQAIIGDYFDTLNASTAESHGDYIYVHHGLKGIRGEALNGLQLIYCIPSVHHYNDDIVHHEYLLHLMSSLDDTTIIHKTDIDTLRTVQKDMTEIIEQGGYQHNKERIQQLSDTYKERCISPGGSADMLVIKIIFEEVKHLLDQISWEE